MNFELDFEGEDETPVKGPITKPFKFTRQRRECWVVKFLSMAFFHSEERLALEKWATDNCLGEVFVSSTNFVYFYDEGDSTLFYLKYT